MTAIAGTNQTGGLKLVERMLKEMSHRGSDWSEIVEIDGFTLGLTGTENEREAQKKFTKRNIAQDGSTQGRYVTVLMREKKPLLKRDPIGVSPLYYGWKNNEDFCFASEVKGLQKATTDVNELPAGCQFNSEHFERYFKISVVEPDYGAIDEIAGKLRELLTDAVDSCIGDGYVGAWLSGGLDSCVISSLASRRVKNMHTFVGGVPGAPDVVYAREMADHLQTRHHEVLVKPEEVLKILPEVIYHLESFDALLVRSSIMNYLVARETAQYVPAVFSGEGGDELFAGYEYLKQLDPGDIQVELVDIIQRLHNTALQRVDRCAAAFSVTPHVCFLDPRVVSFALRIPSEYKLRGGVEKWILRRSVADLIPSHVLNRTKSKFWQGSGVETMLLDHAKERISDSDFLAERHLSNGWELNSKEELMYFRIFKQYFGMVEDLSWMGRTKGAPRDSLN